MTNEISRQAWKEFFDRLSRNRLEQQTKVEVLKNDIGAQVLSDGLPLIGFMFEEKAGTGESAIEIIVGEEAGAHQTHTVFNPQKVFFDEGEGDSGGTIEIEDASGAKTLVRLTSPVSVLVAYEETEIAVQA
jgi:hypothetical protein